jgi:hypothetical protein
MEEQDDSKKRTGTGFSCEFRRVKRPTSGPIPDVVRNSDGHMYIVRAFKEEMRGKKIPDDMVVKAANGRWFTEQEKNDFMMKSTPRCPTYGVCSVCLCFVKSVRKKGTDILSQGSAGYVENS